MQLTPEQINLLGLPKGSTVTLSIESPKPEKWEPPITTKGFFINSKLEIGFDFRQSRSPNVFPTLKSAESACDAITSYLRQLAWLRENDDGWFADWNNHHQTKYRITYNHCTKEWGILTGYKISIPGAIYMSKSNAEKLAALLNSGVVEF